MGSALFLVWLPVPTDGSPPDWAAAHAAVDQLTTRQLNEELLDALDLLLADPEEDEATYDARVLTTAQRYLRTRLEELQEAYGDGGTGMSGELTYLHVFGRRLLITGGSSWGDPPTEIFTALDELTEFPTIVAALGGQHPVDRARPGARHRRFRPPGRRRFRRADRGPRRPATHGHRRDRVGGLPPRPRLLPGRAGLRPAGRGRHGLPGPDPAVAGRLTTTPPASPQKGAANPCPNPKHARRR